MVLCNYGLFHSITKSPQKTMKTPRATHVQQNKKVFISYSRSGDEGTFVHDLVEQLHQDLTANGCEVWSFERESVGGTKFQKRYKQAVGTSNYFLLFCTDSARGSKYIAEEIETALANAKPIIQILIDNNGPHPLLKEKNLAAIPYNDENHRNRVYLLSHVLKAIGLSRTVPPGDKFRALGLLWKVYQRDQMYYPICNQDSIQLLGSESSRMDIQTEDDFTYASMQLKAESNWRTDTSIGFEKWYGSERYSITLQDGYIWIRWRGLFRSRSKHYKIINWQEQRLEKLIGLEIRWDKINTQVFVNDTQICQERTLVHRPLKIRLDADIDDYLTLEHLSFE
jgi:hypothetical protein